jgi:hypothetical protein
MAMCHPKSLLAITFPTLSETAFRMFSVVALRTAFCAQVYIVRFLIYKLCLQA